LIIFAVFHNETNNYLSPQILEVWCTKTTRYADGNPGSGFGQAQKCDIFNQLMGSEPLSHNCIYPMTIQISTHTKSAAQVASIQKDHTLRPVTSQK
jgi:hypothetical protein